MRGDLSDFLTGPLPALILMMFILLPPAWAICRKAGFPSALSLLVIIPYLGTLTLAIVLAFVTWPIARPRN